MGLDLSAQLENGRRWRWFGAPVAEVIGYDNTSPHEAELFNGILKTVCFAGRKTALADFIRRAAPTQTVSFPKPHISSPSYRLDLAPVGYMASAS